MTFDEVRLQITPEREGTYGDCGIEERDLLGWSN